MISRPEPRPRTDDEADTAEYVVPVDVKSESTRARETKPGQGEVEPNRLGIADAEHTANIAGNHGRCSPINGC